MASAGEVYIADGAGSGAWGPAGLSGLDTAKLGQYFVSDGAGGGTWQYGELSNYSQFRDNSTIFTFDNPGSLGAYPYTDDFALIPDGDFQPLTGVGLPFVNYRYMGGTLIEDNVITIVESGRYRITLSMSIFRDGSWAVNTYWHFQHAYKLNGGSLIRSSVDNSAINIEEQDFTAGDEIEMFIVGARDIANVAHDPYFDNGTIQTLLFRIPS